MYFNVYGEKVSRKRYREMVEAGKNRRELIAAGLTSRRDLMKLGLLTAGGMLVAKSGLSARAYGQQSGSNQVCLPGNQAASPNTRAFVDPLPIMPVTATVPLSSLSPAPTICPNTAGGEVRAACHQAPELNIGMFPFPPPRVYQMHQRAFQTSQSPDLPKQTVWGFDDGTHGPISPGPTYQANYGIPQMTRNIND